MSPPRPKSINSISAKMKCGKKDNTILSVTKVTKTNEFGAKTVEILSVTGAEC